MTWPPGVGVSRAVGRASSGEGRSKPTLAPRSAHGSNKQSILAHRVGCWREAAQRVRAVSVQPSLFGSPVRVVAGPESGCAEHLGQWVDPRLARCGRPRCVTTTHSRNHEVSGTIARLCARPIIADTPEARCRLVPADSARRAGLCTPTSTSSTPDRTIEVSLPKDGASSTEARSLPGMLRPWALVPTTAGLSWRGADHET